MRELGKRIHRAVLQGADFKLPVEVLRKGADITQSPNFRYLNGEEIKYSATNQFTGDSVDETWMRVMRGRGVTILPLIELGCEGRTAPILIFKPQPSVESWSIELVSGGVSGVNTPETAAEIELQQETGLRAGKITIMKQLQNVWQAPHRLNTTDTMVIAESLTFVGRNSDEREEAPISPFIATWPEVIAYLENNVIKYAASIATLSTYLLFHAPDVFKDAQRS
jgi:8-oxo-dGTP pyrophosphatase MutT (NUDIX family)